MNDENPYQPKGLLDRWDQRNQRIVERQNGNALRRDQESAQTRFRVTSADGRTLTVWAQPSGYPYRYADGGADWLDLIYLPVLWGVAVLRHRHQFRQGWSVAVITKGPVFEKILRLERFASKDEAKVRAAELAHELTR